MTPSILVIPGIKGFQLIDQADGRILWRLDQDTHDRLDDLALRWDDDQLSCSSAGRAQVVPGELETGIYGFLREHLQTGSVPGQGSIAYFRYDWRLPSLYNRHQLAAQLAAQPPGSVILVAHSLGALLTCALLADPDFSTAPLAGIVFVSPPFDGVPSALDAMFNGDDDVPAEFRCDYRCISFSFPSLFELLPVYPDALVCDGKPFSLLQQPAGSRPGNASVTDLNLAYMQKFRQVVTLANPVLKERLTSLQERCLLVGSSGVATPGRIELTSSQSGNKSCFSFERGDSSGYQKTQITLAGDGRVPLRSFAQLAQLFPTVIIGSQEQPLNHSAIMSDFRFLNTIRQFIESIPAVPVTTAWWSQPGEQVRHYLPGDAVAE
ncbi:MAG: alpha/beta fold hydrolase [Candidatus Delongbacteria bacterium]|nr:alpha/beta fold hydrolase [bacterium]MBL7033169.1 alpha/beta fold hydrolase [Candidatus Delongbacteria bacterium]